MGAFNFLATSSWGGSNLLPIGMPEQAVELTPGTSTLPARPHSCSVWPLALQRSPAPRLVQSRQGTAVSGSMTGAQRVHVTLGTHAPAL